MTAPINGLFRVATVVHTAWAQLLEAGTIPHRGVIVGETDMVGVLHDCPPQQCDGHIDDLDAAISVVFPPPEAAPQP